MGVRDAREFFHEATQASGWIAACKRKLKALEAEQLELQQYGVTENVSALTGQLQEELEYWEALQTETLRALEKLPAIEAKVLYLKYIKGWTVLVVAESLGLSRSAVNRTTEAALSKFQIPGRFRI